MGPWYATKLSYSRLGDAVEEVEHGQRHTDEDPFEETEEQYAQDRGHGEGELLLVEGINPFMDLTSMRVNMAAMMITPMMTRGRLLKNDVRKSKTRMRTTAATALESWLLALLS